MHIILRTPTNGSTGSSCIHLMGSSRAAATGMNWSITAEERQVAGYELKVKSNDGISMERVWPAL